MPQSRSKRSYGAPLSTPRPGGTTRVRPKVGDRDPDYKPQKPKPSSPVKPAAKKPAPTYNRRDYRGVEGAVDDADKGKQK